MIQKLEKLKKKVGDGKEEKCCYVFQLYFKMNYNEIDKHGNTLTLIHLIQTMCTEKLFHLYKKSDFII